METLAIWSLSLAMFGLILFFGGWWFKWLGEDASPDTSEKSTLWYYQRGWRSVGLVSHRLGLAALAIAGVLFITVIVVEALG